MLLEVIKEVLTKKFKEIEATDVFLKKEQSQKNLRPIGIEPATQGFQ
jgi:hypothetical protein